MYDIWQRSNRCVKSNEYGVNITPAQRIGESYLRKLKKKKKCNFFIGAYLKHSKREILMFGLRIFVSFFTTDILLFDHYDNEIKDNL